MFKISGSRIMLLAKRFVSEHLSIRHCRVHPQSDLLQVSNKAGRDPAAFDLVEDVPHVVRRENRLRGAEQPMLLTNKFEDLCEEFLILPRILGWQNVAGLAGG